MCYSSPAAGSELCRLLGAQGEYIASRIGRAMLPAEARPPCAVVLQEEEKEHKLMKLGEQGEVRHALALGAPSPRLATTLPSPPPRQPPPRSRHVPASPGRW